MKDKNWNKEYETRELDVHGDAVDVNHYPTKREALKAARNIMAGGAVAVVVEYHKTRYASALSDRYETYDDVAAFGDTTALEDFGWEGEISD